MSEGETPTVMKTWHWILWWRLDESEIQQQVTNYKNLGWFKSARKISVLCLLLSVAITIIFSGFGLFDDTAYFDAALMAILALFIYFGHRWAMIAAMVLWTLEKSMTAFGGIGKVTPSGGGF
jgi:lysylphosphatidylglycerol synthetase-like protein (DUF2156 family)